MTDHFPVNLFCSEIIRTEVLKKNSEHLPIFRYLCYEFFCFHQFLFPNKYIQRRRIKIQKALSDSIAKKRVCISKIIIFI